MSLLSPRLQLKVAQKQILTPGLVQMVTVLQLNRLELKEMITQEIVKNPVLEESAEEAGEEITPEELQPLLEAEAVVDPADQQLLDAAVLNDANSLDGGSRRCRDQRQPVPGCRGNRRRGGRRDRTRRANDPLLEPPAATDPFDEIDFGSFFDDYLDPGYKSPASESVEKPSFETFLSAPVTLGDHLRSQLSVSVMSGRRSATRPNRSSAIWMRTGTCRRRSKRWRRWASTRWRRSKQALKVVQSLDPAGVGARNLRECLLLQIESINGKGGVAWQIVSNHMRLLETRQYQGNGQGAGRGRWSTSRSPCSMIQHLNPRPGLRYSGAGARVVEPDVYFIKDGDDYIIQMNDEDVPQLRLNAQYRKMLDRDNGATKEVRDYVRERYTSAIQLMKNIEQRKQTILKVCQAIVRRQIEFLSARARCAEADDDQGSGRRSRRASFHRQPRGGQQIRAHAAGRFRTALLLLRSRAGSVGRRHAAAAAEAQGEEDDRRGGPQPSP